MLNIKDKSVKKNETKIIKWKPIEMEIYRNTNNDPKKSETKKEKLNHLKINVT